MIYNSNTGSKLYRGTNSNFNDTRGPSSGVAGTSSQYGYDVWTGRPDQRNMIYKRDNATFDPYKGHLSILKSPNVNYGPLEDPTFIGPGLDKYANSVAGSGYIKISDPLGRSAFGPSKESRYKDFGGDISLLQLQQTMNELKDRIEIESTGAYNRNVPPASRINRNTTIDTKLQRILPDAMDSAKSQMIRPTMVPLPMGANPNMSSGSYYNMVTGRIEVGGFFGGISKGRYAKKDRSPELIEDVIEENMLWKQNTYHGADYKESPDTTDKTKETIKTIKATGELVTTDISDSKLTKDKETYQLQKESKNKESLLQEKMEAKKKTGFLLGIK
jgi:hypothetical protein